MILILIPGLNQSKSFVFYFVTVSDAPDISLVNAFFRSLASLGMTRIENNHPATKPSITPAHGQDSLFSTNYSLLAPPHSVLKLFTGFAIAALIAWKLTVINAMPIAVAPAIRNIHTLILILYAKSCSHSCIK